ncbi:MAG: hypothetical protein Q9M50_06775 [Methylococcales bacterium]|nr:hypothetical protein [Methylococcales bacterium]
MAQKDIISKQIFKRILVDVATYIFKLDLQEAELIETEQQRIEDRRSDLVARVVDRSGKRFILHLEIQNQNQAIMPHRMLRYLSDICLNYPNEAVYQYLLYIGKESLTMKDGIITEQLNYQYPVIDMHTLDYQFFMQQNSADALVLAVLCDFKDSEPRTVIHDILSKLIILSNDDSKMLREYISILEILASNRNLNLDIQREFKMLDVELEKLPSFLIGEEKGQHDKAIIIAKQLLKLNLSFTQVAQITELSIDELKDLN